MSSMLSSLASYALPALSKLYSSQSTTTKYPGAESSPWLPGSNPVKSTNNYLENATSTNGSKSYYNYGTTYPTSPYGRNTTTTTDKYGNTVVSYNGSPTTTTQQTGIQQPRLNYDLPHYDTMSWEEAMTRARSVYQPMYESSVLTQNKLAQDNRDRYSQALAARGYGNRAGGKFESAGENLTQQQAAALENLRNAYESQVASAAAGLYNSDLQFANNRLSNAISLQNNQNNAELGKWQTMMGMSENEKDRQNNRYNSALEFWLNILSPDYEE